MQYLNFNQSSCYHAIVCSHVSDNFENRNWNPESHQFPNNIIVYLRNLLYIIVFIDHYNLSDKVIAQCKDRRTADWTKTYVHFTSSNHNGYRWRYLLIYI